MFIRGRVQRDEGVLVLYSEDKAHPAHELTDQGIRVAFQANKLFDVQVYTEYLDVSRFSSPARAHALADYLRGKYADTNIDAIIAVYGAAVKLLLGEARDAFPDAPIIACGLSRDYAQSLDRSPSRSFITGVVMGDNIAGMVDDALRMRPGTKRVALIVGTAPNEFYAEQAFREGLKPYAGKLELIDLTKLPMEDILARVGSLPPDTIVLYPCLFRDGAGRSFIPREALSLISRAANAPVFSLYDTYLGYGIVGGRLVSLEEQGKEAAARALRILSGETPASIPFTGEQAYVNAYDWRELKRWKIPETALPAGAEIRFRQASYWEAHKWEITGVAVLIMVETALIFGLVTNLLLRRKAERALRQSESKYRALYDGSADGIFLLDDSGTILDGNEAAVRMYGYPLEEVRGTKIEDLIHPDDLKTIPSKFQDMLRGKNLRIDRRVRKKDGTYLTVEVTGSRVGENLVQGLYRDITERKEMESLLRQRAEDLAQSNADLEHFAYVASHDLQEPLRNVASCLQMLEQGNKGKLGEDSDHLIHFAVDGARKMKALIMDLLTYSRLTTRGQPFKAVDVQEVLDQSVGNLKSLIEGKGAEITRDRMPTVRGDSTQLLQVFQNLISNAIKFGPGESPKVHVSAQINSNEWIFSVEDNGIGIEDKYFDRIFVIFQQLSKKMPFQGTGMGLAIVKKIVERHRGRVWVESEVGVGSTFCFTIPQGEKQVF
jgi:PAS domain S-box-containing protein